MNLFLALSVFLIISLFASGVRSAEWPVLYKRHDSRPPVDPYCKPPMYAFCPTGESTSCVWHGKYANS